MPGPTIKGVSGRLTVGRSLINSGGGAAPITYSISGTVSDGTRGIAGVTMSLGARSAVTDVSGNYTIDAIPSGTSGTLTPSKTNCTFYPATRVILPLSGNLTANFGSQFTLIYDTFTEADGTLLTNHTPDTTVAAAKWDATIQNYGLAQAMNIRSGYGVNNTNAITVGAAAIETGQSDVIITATLTTINGASYGGNGLIFRVQNTTNYWTAELVTDSNGLRIAQVVNGTQTTKASQAVAISANTSYTVKLTLTGSSMKFEAAGTSVSYTSSTGATATKHGILSVSQNSSNYCKIDTFQVQTVDQTLNNLRSAYVAQQFGMFLHYNMSTFVNMEWANANLNVNTFAPSGLDIDNWLDAAVSAGMEYAILTTKHHDGFALWPTAYHVGANPAYGVASTTWYANNGQPDIVAQFVAKCRTRNINPCFYYSIWDITYEAQSGKTAASDAAAYIAMIETQLAELLSNYGNIGAIWTDGWGWNAAVGNYTNIPYATIYSFIKSYQPGCLLLENSHEHPTTHSDIELYEVADVAGGNTRLSEVSYTIRADGKWFYCSTLDQTATALKSAATINANIQANITNNAAYLLDVTPTTAGVLPPAQVARLAELHV